MGLKKYLMAGFLAVATLGLGLGIHNLINRKASKKIYPSLVEEYAHASGVFHDAENKFQTASQLAPPNIIGEGAGAIRERQIIWDGITRENIRLKAEYEEGELDDFTDDTKDLIARINSFEEGMVKDIKSLTDFVNARQTAISNEDFVLSYQGDFFELLAKYQPMAHEIMAHPYNKSMWDKANNMISAAGVLFSNNKDIDFPTGIREHDRHFTTQDYLAWIKKQKKVVDAFRASKTNFDGLETLYQQHKEIGAIVDANMIEIVQDTGFNGPFCRIVADGKDAGYIMDESDLHSNRYLVYTRNKLLIANIDFSNTGGLYKMVIKDGDDAPIGTITYEEVSLGFFENIWTLKMFRGKDIIWQPRNFLMSEVRSSLIESNLAWEHIKYDNSITADNYIWVNKIEQGDGRMYLSMLILIDYGIDQINDN